MTTIRDLIMAGCLAALALAVFFTSDWQPQRATDFCAKNDVVALFNCPQPFR